MPRGNAGAWNTSGRAPNLSLAAFSNSVSKLVVTIRKHSRFRYRAVRSWWRELGSGSFLFKHLCSLNVDFLALVVEPAEEAVFCLTLFPRFRRYPERSPPLDGCMTGVLRALA